MGIRIGATFLILFSVLFLPFIFTVLFALCAILYFKNYYEAILVLFLSDLIYGASETRYFHMYFVGAIVTTITLFTMEALKTRLKFYQKTS